MNDVIYRDIIERWLDIDERPILQRKDLWLLSRRRIMMDNRYCSLIVDLHLHCASPCFRRYCICSYFTIIDKCVFYRTHPQKPI